MQEIREAPGTLTPVGNSFASRTLATHQLYTVGELMRITGMSRKQITYWAKIGIVRPSLYDSLAGTGQPSLFYTRDDLVTALIASELRAVGFTPRQLKQVLLNLKSIGFDPSEPCAYLLTDGHSVYAAHSEGEVVDVLKNHRQMLLLLPVHEQVAKLQGVA